MRPNEARKVKTFARNFGARGEEIRSRPCHVAGLREDSPCSGPTECAHDPSRGAGGDRRSMGPLCEGHHRDHGLGRETFDARFGECKDWLRSEWETIARELEDLGVDLPDGWDDTEQPIPDDRRLDVYASRTYGFESLAVGVHVEGFGSQRDARAHAWEMWHEMEKR